MVEKKVTLCEECYKNSEKVICDKFCYFCKKSVCKNCENSISVRFDDNRYTHLHKLDITPLCKKCYLIVKDFDDNFYQNLVNHIAEIFGNKLINEKGVKKFIVKDGELLEKE